MIRWIVRRFGVEVSLDVNDCETRSTLQMRSIVDLPDRVEKLKAEMTGLYRLRGGTIGESMMVNAHELAHAMNPGLKAFDCILTEGAEIYDAHIPRSYPAGVKF